MTLQSQIAALFNRLIAWLTEHPVVVRLAIIIAVILAVTIWSYSVTYAEPLSGGGGGCGC
jgi:hypothetical protein